MADEEGYPINAADNMADPSKSLKIANDLNNDYKNEVIYDQTESIDATAAILNCCGNISKCVCFPCAPCGCGPLMQVKQGEIGLLIHQGRLKAKLGPGLHTYNTCLDQMMVVSLKTQVMMLPRMNLITKDNVTIQMGAFCSYNIMIPEYAVFRVENVHQLISQLTLGTMKTTVAKMTLNELLTKRQETEDFITKVIDEKTDYFGIKVISIDTLSMDLPRELEHALVAGALAERESKAKIIDAKGNLESAKYVKASAKELSKNKVSLQLQYFEVLKKISEEKPTRLILPYFLSDKF